MKQPCGCCTGVEQRTPAPTDNPAGLSALTYRVGTHASFFESMRARLSSADFAALAALTTRASNDPALALLDCWATIADVLTFYQERIANEGYLRTATERRSILELARLIGYALRPGVASSVYLAYTLEQNSRVVIPAGSRVQSLPGPGELPQSFETAEPLESRSEWNALKPRLTRPQQLTADASTIYLAGISTNLKPNDPLLIVLNSEPQVYRITAVTPDSLNQRTVVELRDWDKTSLDDSTRRSVSAVGRSMPASVTAERLRELGHDLEQLAGSASPKIEQTLRQLATALLRALARTHQSADPALIADLQKALASVQGVLESMINNSNQNSLLKKRLEEVRTWVDAAIAAMPAPAALRLGYRSRSNTLDTLADTLHTSIQRLPVLPRNAQALRRSLSATFRQQSDIHLRLMELLHPALQPLYAAYRNTRTPDPNPPQIYAFRVAAALFGNNAPLETKEFDDTKKIFKTEEWKVEEEDKNPHELWLDASYEQIQPESWIIIETEKTPITEKGCIPVQVDQVRAGISRNAYGISGKTTHISWIDLNTHPPAPPSAYTSPPSAYTSPPPALPASPPTADFQAIRRTRVYAVSELLTLAEEPITDDVGADLNKIELDGLYDGLQAGRWMIVSGERSDIKDENDATVPGVYASELVMLVNVEITSNQANDTPHTALTFANDLTYTYLRQSVTIYGNVVRATHGETRAEVLGSGVGSQTFQTFALRQTPLTYLSAPTTDGIASTLEVRVNDVLWHEVEGFPGQQPHGRSFITRTDDKQTTSVMFGDGVTGARLPTGVENVRAVYRTGIGQAGNVAANRISLLATRPLGVKGVINPRPATGGADRESRDQARQSAPLAVLALDRLVSTQDYADFARRYAGISKASAVRASDGQRQRVYLTIAGVDDSPIDLHSDLCRNLAEALRRAGDPHQPFEIAVREVVVLVLSANVVIDPDYLWSKVEARIRAALLDTFGFARRELGQDAILSQAISVIQRVSGVVYVDIDAFGGIPSINPATNTVITSDAITTAIGLAAPPSPQVTVRGALDRRPAQIAYFLPAVAGTLVLRSPQHEK